MRRCNQPHRRAMRRASALLRAEQREALGDHAQLMKLIKAGYGSSREAVRLQGRLKKAAK